MRLSANGDSPLGSAERAAANGHPLTQHFANGLEVANSAGPSRLHSSTPLHPAQLYKNSTLSREEFVRLVLQTLRDVGYAESASTLESESGYSLESPAASRFREAVTQGSWSVVEQSFASMGLVNEIDLQTARFLVSQQKYLELLEGGRISGALEVLRNELAPTHSGIDKLHLLSSLMMCSTTEELMQRACWDGSKGSSRQQLLSDLQQFIPSSILIPPHRMDTLLSQSRNYQRLQCQYHNTNEDFSLFQDHACSRSKFPTVTTHILAEHDDEVWYLQWSHSGRYLASASRDKTVIIWSLGNETSSGVRECIVERQLKDHKYHVGLVAWSTDDSILLTGADNSIKMWNVQTGICLREILNHNQTVSALVWLPDGSGFISGSMDRKILVWDRGGRPREKESWGLTPNRVLTLDVSPDGRLVVVLGVVAALSSPTPTLSASSLQAESAAHSLPLASSKMEKRIVVYDFETKAQLHVIPMLGELTSVKISDDSRFALVNHAPDEIQLWELETMRMVRKFSGHQQPRHVIRSCFGGVNGNFIVSGSEDSKVYIWNRESGAQLEVLSGHQEGSVNAVAWNPRHERIFASCSDDFTIHIWQPQPSSVSEDLAAADSDAKRKTWDGGGDLDKFMS